VINGVSLAEHFRAKAVAALPDESIDAVVYGQAGLSPTLKVFGLAGATLVVGAVLVVVLHVRVALAAVPIGFGMIAAALAASLYAQGRLLVVTAEEVVAFRMHKGQVMELLGRGPRHLNVVRHWDDSWMRLDLGLETVWVSRKQWGEVVQRFALLAPDRDES